MTGHQNRQKHVQLNVIFCIKNCRLENTAHLKDAEKEEGSFKPFGFSKLWIKPVGKCKGKVYAETVHDELGS